MNGCHNCEYMRVVNGRMECRRSAPTLSVVFDGAAFKTPPTDVPMWPEVRGDDWCGEWGAQSA